MATQQQAGAQSGTRRATVRKSMEIDRERRDARAVDERTQLRDKVVRYLRERDGRGS
jgi:hypothetical protein